ncbi:MAG TPA: acetate--CoA ligase family protein, partial [Nocardioidaceae bacterium]
RRVSRRKPVIAVRSGRTTQGVPMGHAVRSIVAPQAAVDAMFRQAGVIQVDNLDEMFDVAQLVAHQPLPKGPRVAVVGNSDAIGLLAADAAAAAGLQVREPVALGPEASAEDFEEALDAAIDDPEVDSVVAVFIPPLNTTGEEVANVLAAVGEQSDKPLVSTFLASEGVPELLRVPDVAGSTAGRGSVPSYPAPESAVRALARVVEYATWLNKPEGDLVIPEEVDESRARRRVNEILMRDPEGRDLDFEELRDILAAYGIELWERVPVDSEEVAVAAGEKLGWDVVLKATAEHLRQRPDLAHVWRNIDNEAEMRDAWQTMHEIIDDPDVAGFIVQKVAQPGVPVSIGGTEDRLFGPVVSFGVSGATTELLGDRSYRIPPMHSGDAADMVREIKAAPLLFGWRGSEKVDVDAIEHLLLRVAQLKNDLPQVRSLELNLVLAGAHGSTVLNAVGRVEPVSDARSDWFVRRLSSQTGDTLPG